MATVRLTDEQQSIVDISCISSETTCCIVQAFAGTGKTTCMAELARQRFAKGLGSTLLLTYSADLKDRTRDMVKSQEGLYVENMHSLVRNILYVGHECTKDKDINNYLTMPNKPLPHPGFLAEISLIVLDEMQDLSKLYYQLVQQLRSFFPRNKRSLVGVGDFFQWLFATVSGSSPQYMCEPEKYFQDDKFKMLRLTQSFRLTPKMCAWINENLNPRKLELHYPSCWAKYGTSIVEYWGEGPVSASETPGDDVSCEVVNSYLHMLPPVARELALKKNALVLVNGLRTDRFADYYPSVSTPFGFKGCEAEITIVVGFDSFTEEICSRQADLEDWPLACYCQMYVSCTRGKQRLIVVRSKSQQAFFTIRGDFTLNIGRRSDQAQNDTTPCNRGIRSMARLFEFVPDDGKLDAMLVPTVVARLDDKVKLGAAPDIADGLIAHTIVHRFRSYYERAIILATYLHCTENLHVSDWTKFMRENILSHMVENIHPQWQANSHWCDQAVKRCIALLTLASLSLTEKCLVPFTYLQLQGRIDLFANWGGIVQVSFGTSMVSLHKAMTTFTCYQNNASHQLFIACYVLDPLAGTMTKVNLGEHRDYYLSEIVCRKNWDFLLDVHRFSIHALLHRGIPVPLSKLTPDITPCPLARKKPKITGTPLRVVEPLRVEK